MGIVAIHAVLLHNGKVLMMDRPSETQNSPVTLWDPGVPLGPGAFTDLSQVTGHKFFCAGHSQLPDGRIFISGGNSTGRGGVNKTAVFNPSNNTFTPGMNMARKRYYPTNVPLANGKTLIFSGWRDNDHKTPTVEQYNPANGNITRLPRSANKLLGLYPRMHLLPGGNILWSGDEYADEDPMTAMFNPATNRWRFVDDFNSNRRYDAPAVLMPSLDEIIVPGGTRSRFQKRANAMASVEMIDLGAANPQWETIAPLNIARIHANAVLLPDEKIFVVGGGAQNLYDAPIHTPEMYDPATGMWTEMADHVGNRSHHSTSLLLPDGRVMLAGSDDGGPNETTLEVYSPPYLFQGARPEIDGGTTTTAGYGDTITINTGEAATIDDVVLMRPGAVTHGNDMEQRLLNLNVTGETAGSLTAAAPANGNVAPPGYYMLFILDEGVPSEASWVLLS